MGTRPRLTTSAGPRARSSSEGLLSPLPPPWATSCFSALPHREYGCWPCAQHLRSQLAAAINTHGASSCGECNRTAELWIPNLGSEAPQALCVTEGGGLSLARRCGDTDNFCRSPSLAAQCSPWTGTETWRGTLMGTPSFSTRAA